MNQILKPGISLTIKKYVDFEDTAFKMGSGLLAVFATPAMIALMEKASLELVAPFLKENENTVGTFVCVRHLRATPAGVLVSCTARLVAMEEGKLDFEVIAEDELGIIGKGTHTRFVIDTRRFLERIEKEKP